MDLEDLMVMEAIWLSIQEPENQRDHTMPVSSQLQSMPGREASPSGGLALAVAALAERQHLRAEPSEAASRIDRARATNHPPESWTEVPLDSGSLPCREDGNWETTHGREVHSAAGIAADGSNVALPLPAANDMTADHLPPESFDEQMMLAMAVSLAEARARTSAPPLTWL